MVKNLLNLFFPKVCYACNALLSDNELDICTKCRHDLPVTNYHFDQDDSVEKVFYGRIKIEHATSLFTFHKKGNVQQLIHNLKYRGHERIGIVLGIWLGTELKKCSDYNSIDFVIPVPLHKKRLRKRGFNQVTKFGQEIAKALNAEFKDDILIKINATTTQVFKNRLSRWKEGEEQFSIQNEDQLHNKHILLVDDLITTGATIEACAKMLQTGRNVKISVASMAIAE